MDNYYDYEEDKELNEDEASDGDQKCSVGELIKATAIMSGLVVSTCVGIGVIAKKTYEKTLKPAYNAIVSKMLSKNYERKIAKADVEPKVDDVIDIVDEEDDPKTEENE